MAKTKKKVSWKTSVAGFIAGLALIFTQLSNYLDADPKTVFEVTKVLAGLGLCGLGWFSRDNKVSSEDSGAKGPIPGTGPVDN